MHACRGRPIQLQEQRSTSRPSTRRTTLQEIMKAKIAWNEDADCASGPLPGRWEYTAPLGQVRCVLDSEEFDYHIDVHPEAQAVQVDALICYILWAGLEQLDPEECEPETLDDGWTRIYLVPVVPVDDEPLIPEALPVTA